MLRRAQAKLGHVRCAVDLRVDDAARLDSVPSDHFDWIFSTFMCCVMRDELQPKALKQFARVLKPGGRFRLLEVIYSSEPRIRKWQERISTLVERIYGARFDRETLQHLEREPSLRVTATRYLKWESYLVIDGVCTKTSQR